MAIHRTLGHVFLVLTATAVMSGCDEFIMSCPFGKANEGHRLFGETRIDQDIWELKTVNGATKPGAGWEIPLHSEEHLLSGSLTFRTTTVIGGCENASKEQGVVTAKFLLAEPNGAPKFPGKSYSGTFEHDLKTGDITVRAPAEEKPNEYGINSVDGLVTGDVMTFSAGIPYVASATVILSRK